MELYAVSIAGSLLSITITRESLKHGRDSPTSSRSLGISYADRLAVIAAKAARYFIFFMLFVCRGWLLLLKPFNQFPNFDQGLFSIIFIACRVA
jgi:hypothetical protein